MKLWLDDERPAPKGYRRCYNPEEVICHIYNEDINHPYNEDITEISLDHDLGEGMGTGYDVLLWIEKQVHLYGYVPPILKVHYANSSARLKMENAIRSIYKYSQQNLK